MQLNPADPVPTIFQDAVTHEIDLFLEQARDDSVQVSDLLNQQFVITRALTAAGKRLRPAFGYWGYAAIAGQPVPEALLRAMSAFELLHTGVLMHDDLIDDSDTRRGQPSAHRQWEAWHRQSGRRGDSALFGRHLALILGDQLLVWSGQMAEQAGLDEKSWQRAGGFFHRMRTEVNAGQILDICAEYGLGGSDQIATAYRVLEEKTSRYTVQRPVQFGAAVAGADPGTLSGLGDYGLHLGRAFQLRDDLLGVFANTAEIGKPSADDLREGKRTVLVAHGLAQATGPERDRLEDILGNPAITEADITWARRLLVDRGAVAEVEDRIAAESATAHHALDALDLSDEGRRALDRLAQMCVDRRS